MPEEENISVDVKGKTCFKHTIKLNEYVKTEILIPKELDLVEFKAITQLANQFFKVSEKDRSDDEGFSNGKDRFSWSRENEDKFIQLVKTGKYDLEALSNEFEIPKEKISSKLNRLKLKLGDYLYNGNGNNISGDVTHPPIDTVTFAGYEDEKVAAFIKWWGTLTTEDKKKFAHKHKTESKVVIDRLKWYRKKLNIKR